MLDGSIKTYPLSTRKEMQRQSRTDKLPLQDLCYATYILPDGRKVIVDVLGTDESENLALLSYQDKESGQREIWLAHRDQNGTPGTWLWTEEQQADAHRNPVRISDAENDFPFEKDLSTGTGAGAGATTPAEKRKVEIIKIGYELGKSREEIEAQLLEEGLDPFWLGRDNEAEWMAAHRARMAELRRQIEQAEAITAAATQRPADASEPERQRQTTEPLQRPHPNPHAQARKANGKRKKRK